MANRDRGMHLRPTSAVPSSVDRRYTRTSRVLKDVSNVEKATSPKDASMAVSETFDIVLCHLEWTDDIPERVPGFMF